MTGTENSSPLLHIQLFRPDPNGDVPLDAERFLLERLEERVAVLDDLQKRQQTVEIAAEVSAKRRFLLLDLEAAGLMSETKSQYKRDWLQRWKFPTLLTYYDAALQLINYLHSSERKRFVPQAKHTSVVGAPVSIDWFRLHVPIAEGWSAFEWLGFCEATLQATSVGSAGEGDIFTRVNGKWCRLRWRKDDGVTPTLFSASFM